MSIKPWRVIDRSYLAQTRWVSLRADRCETADGHLVDPYCVIECRDWVHILAFDDAGRLMVARQYRHGNGRISLEVPCGEVDPEDPSPLHAAQREFLEETGYRADEWIDVGILHPNPARQGNLMYCFVARGLSRVQAPTLDVLEEIECEFLPLSEVNHRIVSGEFGHALHVAALYLALRHLKKL